MAALSPFVPFLLRRRASRGKEDLTRIRERLSYFEMARPTGQLIWLHGASVGESLSVLPLIDEFLQEPSRHVLVTTGTVTSARVMAERLPTRAFHQFAPVDVPMAAQRFLDWWKPDAALFVDSEIWPNLLGMARQRGIPLALVNARMSARSFGRWQRLKRTSAAVLQNFDLCLAQDITSGERFSQLGARDVRVTGNLKADAPPLPSDEGKLEPLRTAIGNRPVLLAASTHRGEEETLLPAQDVLRRKHPDLLTIVVPRHPERGAEIAMLCGCRAAQRRSTGALPSTTTEIYIADTLGELGVLYRTAPFAFVGGSLVPHGGQNPLEPTRLKRAVMAGPHTYNFTPAYDAIFAAQHAGRVITSADIATFAERLLGDLEFARAMGCAAYEATCAMGGAVKRTRQAIEALLLDARA